MKLYNTQQYSEPLSKKIERGESDHRDNNKLTVSPSESYVPEKEKTKVTLSSEAFTMLDNEKAQSTRSSSDNTYEQKKIEYVLAKQKYQEKVNDLPVDYRKMKAIKDKMNEEIKALKEEITKIKQSSTLNDKEKEQKLKGLEEQVASKSLAVIEISKEFSQKLKEQERSKLISSESATEMLKTFNASPPEVPTENNA